MSHTLTGSEDTGQSWAYVFTGVLVLMAVLFNPVLAIVNGHLVSLTPAMVIACEVVIVGAAHLIALLYFRARMAPWYLLIGLLCAFAIFRAVATGGMEVKFLRDVLLIPTFIILGMTFPRRSLTWVLVTLQLIVLAVVVLEAVSQPTYASLFDVKSYYINTRGFSEEDFWNTSSDLFVSATRPSERFFSFVDLHRMSSLFLEPVSLGNYCIIIFAYVLASFRELSPMARLILLGGVGVLIIACDGRLAVSSCLIIAIATLFASRLPQRVSVAIPFIVFIFAAIGVAFLELRAGPDDFAGRVAHTIVLLQKYDLQDLLGISTFHLVAAMDSGLAYLITTQSLFLTVVLWLFIALALNEETRHAAIFKVATALYLSLSMLISFSFLSIKTAALLWFILGAMQTPSGVRKPFPRRQAGWAGLGGFGRA